MVLDAAVPAGDAEARLRAGLDHDVPEVLGAGVLLRGVAELRRGVRGRVRRGLRVGRTCAVDGSSCGVARSEEHTSELQSQMRISYAVFCVTKKTTDALHVIQILQRDVISLTEREQ